MRKVGDLGIQAYRLSTVVQLNTATVKHYHYSLTEVSVVRFNERGKWYALWENMPLQNSLLQQKWVT
jgi:DNA-binding IclR family transcriptional regulator